MVQGVHPADIRSAWRNPDLSPGRADTWAFGHCIRSNDRQRSGENWACSWELRNGHDSGGSMVDRVRGSGCQSNDGGNRASPCVHWTRAWKCCDGVDRHRRASSVFFTAAMRSR